MSKDSSTDPDQHVLDDFKDGMASWARAVQAHKQAPPDIGFASRLASLAQGASGTPVWELVEAWLKHNRSVATRRPNVPRLIGMRNNPGIA